MNRVFLDANVLFSAAISPTGVARAIFELAEQYDSILLMVDRQVITEALGNLQNKRPDALSQALALVDSIGYTEDPPQALADRLRDRVPDPDDVTILAGAIWSEADLLVTGNSKHFGSLYGEHVGGCLVLRPRDALNLLLSLVEEGNF